MEFSEIEEWRWIDGYDNYEVSSLGRVRRRQFLKPTTSNGYLYVNLSKDGQQKRLLISVLVAEAFHGLRPDGMDCCHTDGDRQNNRADNLRWDTRSSNTRDRWKHQKERESRAADLLQSVIDDNSISRNAAAEKIMDAISLLRLT
jgi:hypothetical protein